MKKANCEKF